MKLQQKIDSLTEAQHDHLNNVLRGIAFILAVPLAVFATPYIAGCLLLVNWETNLSLVDMVAGATAAIFTAAGVCTVYWFVVAEHRRNAREQGRRPYL